MLYPHCNLDQGHILQVMYNTKNTQYWWNKVNMALSFEAYYRFEIWSSQADQLRIRGFYFWAYTKWQDFPGECKHLSFRIATWSSQHVKLANPGRNKWQNVSTSDTSVISKIYFTCWCQWVWCSLRCFILIYLKVYLLLWVDSSSLWLNRLAQSILMFSAYTRDVGKTFYNSTVLLSSSWL